LQLSAIGPDDFTRGVIFCPPPEKRQGTSGVSPEETCGRRICPENWKKCRKISRFTNFLLSDNHVLHFKPAAIMYFCAYENGDYKTDATPLNFWQGAFLYYILGNGG
jgi:hypothetical protein